MRRLAIFISKRLVQMLILFVIFLTILFFLLDAQPGDCRSSTSGTRTSLRGEGAPGGAAGP